MERGGVESAAERHDRAGSVAQMTGAPIEFASCVFAIEMLCSTDKVKDLNQYQPFVKGMSTCGARNGKRHVCGYGTLSLVALN